MLKQPLDMLAAAALGTRHPALGTRPPVTPTCARSHRAWRGPGRKFVRETGMHPDLESIVAADEEARARVAAAEDHRERRLAEGRAQREATVAAQCAAAEEALQGEIDALRAEGDKRVEEIRKRQAEHLHALAEAGERKFAEAVRAYQRIVTEVGS